MAFDPARDARRLRIGLLLSALLLLGALALVSARALAPEWRGVQERFYARFGPIGPERIEIRQRSTCSGRLERCTTCHLGAERTDLAAASVPQPYRSHPPGAADHLARGVGCSQCHGGTGRALSDAAAHAVPGTNERDPLLAEPTIQAACGRCHVPGAVPGTERLLAGASEFLQLGCPVCHPLGSGGRGGADYGPDLRTRHRRSLAYLTTSLLEPAANFPESTMPSFEHTFRKRPEALTDMLIYLTSLALGPVEGCGPRDRFGGLVSAPCADCHAGPAGRASGRRTHRCVYLDQRSGQLTCGGCHPGQIPAAGPGQGYCPVVRQHRPACVICHLEAGSSQPDLRSVD